jgi:hypothetical protein
MAGFFDHHCMLAIADMWNDISTNVNQLKSVLPQNSDGTSIFSDAQINRWHESLFPNNWDEHVTIAPAFNAETTSMPAIICQLTDEPAEEKFLGDDFLIDPTTGNLTMEMLVDEQCVIHIYSKNIDEVRVMHVIVRAAIFASARFLMDSGYESLDYVGGGDIGPQLGLLPEDAGIFIRTQRWRSKSKVKTDTTSDLTSKNLLVAAVDVMVGDNEGGVTPSND